MRSVLLLLSAGLLTLVTPILAQPNLPYNPTRVVPARNGSVAYIFAPQSSSTQFSLSWLNTSDTVNTTSSITTAFPSVPFLSKPSPRAFLPFSPDDNGISVLVGDCEDSPQDLELWRFIFDEDFKNGTWKTPSLSTIDDTLNIGYLSAGFAFSPTASTDDVSLYTFGGMCGDGKSSNASDWTADASYSNTMLTVAPGVASTGSGPYQLSLTGTRAPPVAEAGLTITALNPTISNTSDDTVAQQQNFILIGGHTQNAFINMSQLAIFSLPQASWAFVDATQATDSINPRSGHTAVLTEDGSQIVVFGGWVGDIDTPAQPQLVVLDIAQGYGGKDDWSWTSPSSTSSPFPSDEGIYGHGAAMLPGGVMMVAGGYSISSSGAKQKRDAETTISFLNTTSLEWSTTYTNPSTSSLLSEPSNAEAASKGLKTSDKAGLGAGLGLGIAAVAVVAVAWLWYSRRLRAKRSLREKELRELALGAERYHTPLPPVGDDQRYPGMRSASWGNVQEQRIESSGDPFPWAPMMTRDHSIGDGYEDSSSHVDRSKLLTGTPTSIRSIKKVPNGRGSMAHSTFNQHPPTRPGGVFPIEEEDEGSHSGSLRRSKTPRMAPDNGSVGSDPFKDPQLASTGVQQNVAAAQRKKEVEGWVEDWQSAAESMTVSRSTSLAQSRTYSNLSHSRAPPVMGGGSGRGSPEKSDRTGSNLSEQSVYSNSSFQRSVAGTISRHVSQRSASAGYALFSGAAAAMNRFGSAWHGNAGHEVDGSPSRAPSNRSVSLNIDTTRHAESGKETETSSSPRSRWGAAAVGDDQSPTYRSNPSRPGLERGYSAVPDSPSKEKSGSLATSSRRALNLLGSVRRAFSGTGNVDVRDRVAAFESGSVQSSPTKHSHHPEMTETIPSDTATGFWRSRQGAKDWEDEMAGGSTGGSTLRVRRKPVPAVALRDSLGDLEHDEDWDVESAAQQRVVQVMFTVPKEKLRVVNADALSLLSSNRSEVDQDEDKEREQVKRMSSVREHDDQDDDYTTLEIGKDRRL